MSAAGEVEEAQRLVELLAGVWESTVDVLAELDDDEWAATTDCPGWTVKDVASHVIGVESMYAGRPVPDVGEHDWPHVRNDFGRMLEPWVEANRPRAASDVLADLRAVTSERVGFYRGLSDDGWAQEVFTPGGPGTIASLVPFRLFDSWAHEQDIRRAVGAPGDVDSDAGRWNLNRCSAPLAMVVAKRAEAAEGATVEWLAYGPPVDHRWRVAVHEGRGEVVQAAERPTVRLVMDVATFVRLGLGRVDPDAALAARSVSFIGDAELGERVVTNMAFTP